MTATQRDAPKGPDRIRVLQFSTLFAVGGTERHILTLAEGLDRSRFELHFGCLKRRGEFLGRIEALRVPLEEYPIHRLYGRRTLREQLRFARYLRHNRIQIVHTYNFYANVFAIPAARLAGVPVIVASIRDTGIYLAALQRRVQRAMCRAAGCILVNSMAVRRWLIAGGYPPEKIVVIRNGVDLSRFQAATPHGRLRQELGLPDRGPLVAVLSRLTPSKGIDYFLEAAAILAPRFPAARFLIVGEGEHRQALEGRAASLGIGPRVRFSGVRLDVPEILSEVAVSVLPSLSEGFPNILLESMAEGVPVVATAVGGNAEAVEDGVTGLLVPARDSRALARAIGLLLENPALAARFVEAGRQRMRERFSQERMVRET
ncbi:MAG TPA: glycosyltransferase, partial [Candidatus Methylomirabilis sp.]|nr:glycosyltransferase [Candidatus Methylomirabilis sp.]